jgi:hypothetical protein
MCSECHPTIDILAKYLMDRLLLYLCMFYPCHLCKDRNVQLSKISIYIVNYEGMSWRKEIYLINGGSNLWKFSIRLSSKKQIKAWKHRIEASVYPWVPIGHVLNNTTGRVSLIQGKGRLDVVVESIKREIDNGPSALLYILMAKAKKIRLPSWHQWGKNLQFSIHLLE